MTARNKRKRGGFAVPLADPLARLGRRLGRMLWGTLLAGVLGGLLVAGGYAAWRFGGPRLLARPEYRVAVDDIHISPLPPWVPVDLRRQVQQLAGLPDPLPLLDNHVVERVSQAFSLHPWVAEVRRVSKGYPSRLEVEIRYRRPVAMVDVPGGLFPVDVEGVLLPSGDFDPSQARLYPRIEGVRSTPAGTAGTPWGDPLVGEAARIADALALEWKPLGLKAVEAPSAAAADQAIGRVYYLLSEGGSRIAWGRPPGSDHPGELSVEDKISRLKSYATEHGGLEAPAGPYEIDLRHWQGISLRPRRAS